MTRPIVWTVAGSDSGGGAGIQADLHAMHNLGVHGCSVVSALTAQNSVAVTAAEATSAAMFEAQLQALAADMPARVIKTGMLASEEQIKILLNYINDVWLVVDPVAVSTSGYRLADNAVLQAIHKHLLPRAQLVTPNINELQLLTGVSVDNEEQAITAARQLLQTGVQAVVVKGGHLNTDLPQVTDLLVSADRVVRFQQPRIANAHGHGTGCTLASVLASALALNYPLEDALVMANAYVAAGLHDAEAVGQGTGPVRHHLWPVAAPHFAAYPWSLNEKSSLPDQPFALMPPEQMGLYAVVDSVDWIQQLLEQGVRTLQLRIKTPLSAQKLEQQIAQTVALGRQYQARIFINDYWQLALKYQAYGVHLGQEDLADADLPAIQQAGLRLGISTHGYFEILRAKALRPSYIALGHVFPTTTKQMPSQPQGLGRLADYAALLGDYTTVAIGGIDLLRVKPVLATGVDGVAVVRAITEAADITQAVEELTDAFG
ncbi:phosphomethylpyrimidine kinase [Aliidiomarina minuta]|uniref:Thiamine-phosphate synthase n=1 Tax=Aliidiomarina minuta TaxID=880057 RepID=A0A432W3K4_9GAMM|nr:thiamine phosphate synthase [Aliidiomarina minuta]RUO23955.1 phosphomethylpyrimidine kinase [Aliidiomarina minuta]